jgi:glycosyltransferase involved in cell wall biosynthesis
MHTLYIVIPCYNEQEVIHETTKRLTNKFDRMIKSKLISPDSKMMFVNDGSKDTTWEIINKYNKDNKYVCGINLAHNKGHQNALLAGLMVAKDMSDMVISMDADLQDDIEVIDQFVAEFENGSDIVYGVRGKREKDSFFKRFTAEAFYHIMEKMGIEIVFNHADYRLMSKRSLEALSEHKEVNLFLRGIVPTLGYKTSKVTYRRDERFAGESKYPLSKMLSFAAEGITSFTVKPVRMITTLGFTMFMVSIIMLIYFLVVHFTGGTIQGWTSLAVSVWAIGGLQLLAIGVVGEYVGKIYMETKGRPRYIIESVLIQEK